jgi:hypothetical protein
MGAHIDIDFFGIYESKKHVNQAFNKCKKFAKEVDFVGLKEEDFVKLNDNYLLFKAGASMPYSDCSIVEDWLSILSSKSLFSQYVLKSNELEMDEFFTYKEAHREINKIVSSHQNKITFTSYFQVPETRKVFENERSEKINLDTRKTNIENQEYIYFENISKSLSDFKLLLNNIFLSVENNEEVLATYVPYKEEALLNHKLLDVFKQLFISDDPLAEKTTFIYGQRQDMVFCIEYQGKEPVTIGNTIYEDCIKIKHGYLDWPNTYELKAKGIKNHSEFAHNFVQTYWAKDIGIIRILTKKMEDTTVYNCISISENLNENLNKEEPILNIPRSIKKNWWEFWK